MSASFTPPPPPLAAAAISSSAAHLPPPESDYTSSSPYFSSASASSASPSSVITVMIIITSAVILSATIYLLLRVLSKRASPSSAADDVVLRREAHKCDVASKALLESLPLFSFASVTGNLSGGGDCSVCLSKFERHDQLRLLPLCCHAFHAECIDTWIASNQTCPLCRSTVFSYGADALDKFLSTVINGSTNDVDISGNGNRGSFRIEIGSVSRRRAEAEDVEEERRRSYSVGSFEYILDDNAYEVSVERTTHHRRGISNLSSNAKDSSVGVPLPEPPGEVLAAEVSGGRNWLREYVDRLSSVSISSRATSFRSSGRFFTGSSRRSEAAVVPEDLEANHVGEEISVMFRWLSGI